MKKHLATFAAALLLLGACSKNDDNPTPPTPNPAPAPTPPPPAEERSLFPKKAKVTTDDGSYEATYTVRDGKLISVKSTNENLGSSITFTYEGNRIVKQASENGDGDHSTDSYTYYENGLLKTKTSDFTEITNREDNALLKYDTHEVTSYTYDDQKRLTQWVEDRTTVHTEIKSGTTTTTTEKTEYTYTADYSAYPKVVVKETYKNKNPKHIPSPNNTTEYHSTFDTKGRVVRYERFDSDGKLAEATAYTYEDGKHFPLAYDAFVTIHPEAFYRRGSGADYLPLTEKETNADGELQEETTYENTYDDRGFPIKIIEKHRSRYKVNNTWEPWEENTQTIVYEY